jgi:hypothetical protein
MSEIPTYRFARILIDQYHDRAWAEAIARMDRHWLADNEEEMHRWRLIANAISMIQQSGRFPAETLH